MTLPSFGILDKSETEMIAATPKPDSHGPVFPQQGEATRSYGASPGWRWMTVFYCALFALPGDLRAEVTIDGNERTN
jgi:hypothetical protein